VVWIVAGLTTSVAAAYVLALVNLRLHLAVFAYMGFGIVPVGALGCGMVAASGYALAARLLRRIPGPWAQASMFISGLLAFALIYWFEYTLIEVDGRPLSSVMSFGTFVPAVIGATTVHFGPFDTSAIDDFGYPLAGLQALGFSFAGPSLFFRYLSTLHCERCGRFLPEMTSTFGYGSPADLLKAFDTTRGLAAGGSLASAQAHVASLPRQELNHKLDLETTLCARCERAHYRLRLLAWAPNQTWVAVPQRDIRGHVDARPGRVTSAEAPLPTRM
jgi:hypothetical protein